MDIFDIFKKWGAALFAMAFLCLIWQPSGPAKAEYVSGQQIDYSYPALDWHSGAVTRYIQGPAGKFGVVTHIMVSPTTSFVGTTTPATVQVGYGSGATLYNWANVQVGATVSGTLVSGSPTVTLANITSGVPVVGDVISGTSIPGATTITAYTPASGNTPGTITMSANASGTVTTAETIITAAQVAAPHVASTYAAGILQLGSGTYGQPPYGGAAALSTTSAGYLPADKPAIVTFNPSTGGSVAGVADVVISIKWF